ncbi:phosphoenolpyruvate carboxykinase [candidate division MSBL1 archaeon SCGC-AAA261O19]|uniref:Phosphoenolpyruvate carboxykinase [GTP] n=1 Tax=candidate division MSBL1 archaeon SCGC-AAA261O19 TaxID=1698277 RepID=A0A133VEM6_9EURY|nr:phosphoenolpyruvate carboxykinase [candidate division MSBL1 archaeon SCGC-AAA261O19]
MVKNQSVEELLKSKCGKEDYEKLSAISNPPLHRFIAKYVELCNPDKVFVSTGSPKDNQYIRKQATSSGEERKLATEGHTVHFDGYYDQARDEENTKFLLPKGVSLGSHINSTDRRGGLKEIQALLKNSMQGHQMYVCFFCLGPTNSEFSLPCVQLTDSSYVAHSSVLLYRPGYEEFKRLGSSPAFFKFLHSEGELEDGVSKNIHQRRIYIDLQGDTVYSANTQYGGNTIGHKKLAMRLAIHRASKEHWLTEHMFLMGVHGPEERVSYFTGAFPSLCGKTSTSMIKEETIVGDDIVYLKKMDGEMRAVNVEKGIFGILQGVNSKDDPLLWKTLHNPGEIIFSNVLVTEDKNVYWLGKDGEVPKKGVNHSGDWTLGKKDANGEKIPPAHPNARFTLNMDLLENVDPKLNDPEGVKVSGIIYGGRDSDTLVPVKESFNWTHGVMTMGASLESETTAAALGEERVRKINPMANLAFLSIPIGEYIENHLDFGRGLEDVPPIFSVNYFLRDSEGNFLNEKDDKRVWLKWMELRVHRDVEAIKTPTGYMPRYEDLKKLFKEVLGKNYSKEDYVKQFTLRVPEHLAKSDRVKQFYEGKVKDIPEALFEELEKQEQRLKEAKEEYGDYISPEEFE